jgi:hypothetical protein
MPHFAAVLYKAIQSWLYAGSDDGGTWLAKLHTVVRT